MWPEGSVIGFCPEAPANFEGLLNPFQITDLGPYPVNQWHTVGIPTFMPDMVKAINLVGLIIITHDQQNNEIADAHVHFRAYGSATEPWYVGQACIAHFGGIRSGISVLVPVRELKYQF
jgi:hypothetical protein